MGEAVQQLTFEDAPIETVLSLPPPISVNKLRRFDPQQEKLYKAWVSECHGLVYQAGGLKRFRRITGKFEARLIIDEHLNRLDLDNAAKVVIDYARRLGLIVNDDKKHMRRVVIEWGHAPRGCRLILREIKEAG